MTTTTPRRALSLRLAPATWAKIDDLAIANDRSLNYTLAYLVELALKELAS